MAQNNTITFYDLTMAHGATTSPFVWATKYALKHKGFDLEVVPGGFTGIMERTGGKTERLPAIVDDGFAMFESLAINLYLAKKANRLWPGTREGEGRVYQWTLFGASELEPVIGQWYAHVAYLPAERRKPELAEEAAVKLPRRLDAIETALATREWLADEMFSIADLNLASVLYRGPAFGLDRWPRVADWHRRCYARPVARATVAEREAKA